MTATTPTTLAAQAPLQEMGAPAPSTTQIIPPPTRATRIMTGVLCAALLALGCVFLAGIAFAGDQPYWILGGMQAVACVAAVFGLLLARGKFAEGPGMALLCVAGTLFTVGVLGYLSARSGVVIAGKSLSMKPWVLAHALSAAMLGLLASWEVLRRNPRSVSYLIRAAITGAPLLAGAAAWWWWRKAKLAAEAAALAAEDTAQASSTSSGSSPSPALGLPTWIVWTLAAMGALLAIVLISACAHCLIRAFEMGREPGRESGAKPTR